MGFFRQFINKEIVYVINDEIIKDALIEKIVNDIKPNYKIGLDMKNVKTLDSVIFIKYLKENRYKLYNLQNDVLTYLALILQDGKLKSYMSFEDFKFDKHELIKRNFKIA